MLIFHALNDKRITCLKPVLKALLWLEWHCVLDNSQGTKTKWITYKTTCTSFVRYYKVFSIKCFHTLDLFKRLVKMVELWNCIKLAKLPKKTTMRLSSIYWLFLFSRNRVPIKTPFQGRHKSFPSTSKLIDSKTDFWW